MKPEEFKLGALITGSKWSEPVEIDKVENYGNHMRSIGATKSGKRSARTRREVQNRRKLWKAE